MEQMIITSAQYINRTYTNDNEVQQTDCIGIKVIIGDEIIHVPLDPTNRHYAEIMRQVEAGELTIQDAE